MQTKRAVKYLGLMLDTKLTFWDQIRRAADKAAVITARLGRIMANVGGPTPSKRRLLMSTVNSVLLYGAELWADALKYEKYRKRVAAVQRRGALRVACAYRTVSESAILVVAGVVPIDLMAQERKQVFNRGNDVSKAQAQKETRARSLEIWKERWANDGRGKWTVRIVKTVDRWLTREHGEVGYYVTQFLTGHGLFRAYLHKMGIVERPDSIHCGGNRDDVHHTFFLCDKWKEDKQSLEAKLLVEVTPDNIVDVMLSNEESWNMVSGYVEKLLRKKKTYEDMVVRHDQNLQ